MPSRQHHSWRCIGDRVPSDNRDPLLILLGRALGYDSLYLSALMWGRAIGSLPELLAIAQGRPPWNRLPPQPSIELPPTYNAELTSEWVDLRMPPAPWNASLVTPELSGAAREALAHSWAHALLHSSPLRLSLRDPLHPADATRAIPCAFNASGQPTMRVACHGHPSWGVRHETQHQLTCTDRCAPALGEAPTLAKEPVTLLDAATCEAMSQSCEDGQRLGHEDFHHLVVGPLGD